MDNKLTQTIDTLTAAGLITSTNRWTKGNNDRTYINIAHSDKGYKGCRTDKVYWDHNSNMLVEQSGKGMTPYDYEGARTTIMSTLNAL